MKKTKKNHQWVLYQKYDDTHLQNFHGRLFKSNTIEYVTVKPDEVFLQT